MTCTAQSTFAFLRTGVDVPTDFPSIDNKGGLMIEPPSNNARKVWGKAGAAVKAEQRLLSSPPSSPNGPPPGQPPPEHGAFFFNIPEHADGERRGRVPI